MKKMILFPRIITRLNDISPLREGKVGCDVINRHNWWVVHVTKRRSDTTSYYEGITTAIKLAIKLTIKLKT